MPHYKRIFVIARDLKVQATIKRANIERVAKGSSVEYRAFDPTAITPKFDCDLVIVAGGDGTLFYAVSGLSDPSTPVLHVNMGDKGFLAEVSLSELPEKLSAVLKGRHLVEKVRKISVNTSDGRTGKAMNEVVFASRSWKGVMSIKVEIDGLGGYEIIASGVMVSTPLGSTAFCLASGGPTLDNEVEAVVLSPILPRKHWPPMVVERHREISIRKTGGKEEAILVLDGFIEWPLGQRTVVSVSSSDETVSMIRFSQDYMVRRLGRVVTE